MRKLIMAVLFLCGTVTAEKTTAQVNINIGLQPAWGPAGYDYVEYYYLPDIETYYYVPRRQFIYLNNGRWIYSAGLPSRYRTYNLYNGYKVVVNAPKPYLRHASYKVKYAKYKGNNGKQLALGKSKVKTMAYAPGAGKVKAGKAGGGVAVKGKGKNKHL
ncbi:hypothetical protein IQ13_2854 [Lacibacter cauensis]|uniref:Uncharacterized protein n=1 Tax=Lacibacter cauensis TaxID=510947 RepID=A0A562SGS1_9BACT|nr:hypothetical protein [Lacibacter cauensis]TWI80184.1 hypothetical protein IQ13_2854 [Lacibacter cauensis]